MKCINNERQIGIAFRLYMDDNSDYYPAYEDWAAWGGQKGTNSNSSGEVAGNNLHGGNVDPTNRVMNTYIKNLEAYRCPAERGDPLWKIKSCWVGWGNCYLLQWCYDEFGVEHVGGRMVKQKVVTHSNKGNRIAQRPTTKIIMGDWNWFGDRSLTSNETVWHKASGKRVFPLLFGDTHTENWTFPPSYDKSFSYSTKPDVNGKFW
jgi:hypothetical protein